MSDNLESIAKIAMFNFAAIGFSFTDVETALRISIMVATLTYTVLQILKAIKQK